MNGQYCWSIKVIDGEMLCNGEVYKKIVLKEFFYSKEEAKKAFVRIKLSHPKKKIIFSHLIKGKWCIYDEV